MSELTFVVVLSAALLHALWNAAVKGSKDKVLGMAAVIVGQAIPALAMAIYFPLPSFASLPFFLAGLGFHMGYQIFLMSAYKVGDFTQVYPLARGTGPLLVAVISIVFLGVQFASYEYFAIGLIILGIVSLAAVRQGNGLRNPKAALLALCTGICIAGYSLSDGMGARASESAIGFMASLMFVNGLFFALYVRWVSPGTLSKIRTEATFTALVGGFASFAAYALVVWAFTQAPIALVTALRETSIVFALLIGAFIFREKLTFLKIASTLLTLSGAMVLRFGKFFA